MGKAATAKKASIVGTIPTDDVKSPPVAFMDREGAKEIFKAVVLRFDPSVIATAARVTKECARQYRQGNKFPDSIPLINMARNLPEVKAWLYHEVERSDEGFDSERALTGSVQKLIELAATPGKRGDEARKMLADMARLAARGV